MKDRKNVLLQYQGGGYDGCFWEWNFCFWDKDGEWHNIFTSGSMGVKTEQDALAIIHRMVEQKHYIYDLDNEVQMLDFTANGHPQNVKMVADYLSFNCGIFLEVKCNECGSQVDVLGAIYGDSDLLCEDCYGDHTCGYCGEYWNDTSDFEMTDEYGLVCEYCYEDIQKEQQEERNREALEQAKMNGIIK